jgi:hypothetical protein
MDVTIPPWSAAFSVDAIGRVNNATNISIVFFITAGSLFICSKIKENIR